LGMLYRPKYKAKDGTVKESRTWWMKYYQQGKPLYESTGTDDYQIAKRKLKSWEGQVADHRFPGFRSENTTFDELAADFITDYRNNGRDSLQAAERYVRNLGTMFSRMKALDITSDKINRYILKR
jgi:hypothetical protein